MTQPNTPFFAPTQRQAVTGVDPLEHSSLDAELEIHIEDAHWQYRTAYERWEMHRLPHDRDEAVLHLHRLNTALLARSAAVQAQRHAEFEQRITEQVAFFNSGAALAMAQRWRAA